jgi:hypothetical protein
LFPLFKETKRLFRGKIKKGTPALSFKTFFWNSAGPEPAREFSRQFYRLDCLP